MSQRRTEEGDLKAFQELIHVDGNGCHEYMGGLASNGYGIFQAGGKSVLAHIYAWELVNGPVPEGMVIRHSCDNKACVNAMDSLGGFEGHLVLGSQQDNMDDKVRRDRICRNPRKLVRVSPAERDAMVKLSREGATYYRIGKTLGRDQLTVKRAILSYGKLAA
ncbi:HNH endonuclease signature motif containing protein [Tunturiibacter psychrotolerans]|uniref:HNH endonuclease signature motif containing protein n=1 Tax=Tunturiibacter psychrotolerans TaxID=3069686 RepID=UPI003D1BFB45